jgi:hypothetical protein
MLFSNIPLLFIIVVVLALVFLLVSKSKPRLFPGPDPTPLVGNVFQLNPSKIHDEFETVRNLNFLNAAFVFVSLGKNPVSDLGGSFSGLINTENCMKSGFSDLEVSA